MTDPVPSNDQVRLDALEHRLLSEQQEARAADIEHKLRFAWAQKRASRLIVDLRDRVSDLEGELAIWRQCHSAPKPGECQPIFDRAGRCGTCTACGKNFTCGAKLGYPTDKATARERLSQFVPSVECPVHEPVAGCRCKGHPTHCYRHPHDCGCTAQPPGEDHAG